MKKLTIGIIAIVLFAFFSQGKALASVPSYELISSFDSSINCIFIKEDIALIGTDSGLYYSSDNFKTFKIISDVLANSNISAINYINGKYYVGTDGKGLFVGDSINQWRSLRDLIDCPTISNISYEGNNIYVSSHCSGFFASFDGGKSFLNLNKGLTSVVVNSFLMGGTSGYYLGTDDGLYFSGTITASTSWNKVISNIRVNSLSYFGNTVFAGTNIGLYKGTKNQFEKIPVIGGNPSISNIEAKDGRLGVIIESFGIYLSCDGVKFYPLEVDALSNATAISINSERRAFYVGTKSGKLFSVDLNTPCLLFEKTIKLNSIQKGSKYSFDLTVYDFSFNSKPIDIVLPTFMQAKKAVSDNKTTFTLIIDAANISPQTYSIPLQIKKENITEKVFVSFDVTNDTAIVIKLYVGSTTAYVNGKTVKLDTAPFIDKSSGRTLVPVRFIAESFNAQVSYDANKKEVTIIDDTSSKTIKLYIGKTTAYVNGGAVKIDVAPVILPPGRTFVPVRFISETFNAQVLWNEGLKEIQIIY